MTAFWIELLLTSSVLILVITALRFLLRGRISPRLQYALWALVLVRLLVPVSISSPISIMNAVEPAATTMELRLDQSTLPPTVSHTQTAPAPTMDPAQVVPVTGDSAGAVSSVPAPISAETALLAVWLVGALLVGAWFLWSNFRFWKTLRSRRVSFDASPYGIALPVYVVNGIPSPCLFGLLHPAIYITEDCLQDPVKLHHILSHEQTHYRQRDHIWSALRGVCLSLYWFHPLVWVAAVLSRRDCELSCDAGTLKKLGNSERIPYGRTLLSLMAQKTTPEVLLSSATTMTGGERSRRERITLIAKQPRAKAVTTVLAVALAALCAACTMTGSSGRDMTIYEAGEIQIAIPTKYTDEILINPEALQSGHLIDVYDRVSLEAHENFGWLFSVKSGTKYDYEQYLTVDRSGVNCFAYDENGTYYFALFPTDVQVLNVERTELFEDIIEEVCTDMVERNGLTETSFDDPSQRLSSDHTATVTYAGYGLDNSDIRWTICLIQPATDGPGGIWCVSSYYDEYGNEYFYFPPMNVDAQTYYAQLQMQYDADPYNYEYLTDARSVAALWLEKFMGFSDASYADLSSVTYVGSMLSQEEQDTINEMLREEAEAYFREHAALYAGVFGTLNEEDYARTEFLQAEHCASYHGIVNGTLNAYKLWFSVPAEWKFVEGSVQPGEENHGMRSVAIGWFITYCPENGEESIFTFIEHGNEGKNGVPYYEDIFRTVLMQDAETYFCQGTEIAIPAQYADAVTVVVENDSSTPLLVSVYHRESYDAYLQDPARDSGFLFSIYRYTQQEYDARGEDALDQVFAFNADRRFFTIFPGNLEDVSSSAWNGYAELAATLYTYVKSDAIARNNMTAIDTWPPSENWLRENVTILGIN